MPAEQQGSIYQTAAASASAGATRRRQAASAGFSSPSKARAWFRDVERPRMRGEAVARPPVTLREHVDRYLDATRRPATRTRSGCCASGSKRPVDAFGDMQLRDLERMAAEIAAWRTTLPERSRYGIMQAFRQALEAAVRWGDIDRNPAKLAGPNPPPPPRGVADVHARRGRPDRRRARAVVRADDPVRRRDRDAARGVGRRSNGRTSTAAGRVARVARTHVEGRTKAYGKTSARCGRCRCPRGRWRRSTTSRRGSTRGSCSPAPRGGHVNLRNFRRREWKPALEAAGVPPRRIYDLRSTFASQALAAGVSVFELARIMGTSVRMIERHYGTLLQGSGDAIRGKLDAYLGSFGPRDGHGRGGRVTPERTKPPRLQGFRGMGVLGSNQ